MGPQNWSLDPTPKTPLDPPLEILYALYSAGKNQHLHKEFGRLSPLLDPQGQGPSEILYADFLWVSFPFVTIPITTSWNGAVWSASILEDVSFPERRQK